MHRPVHGQPPLSGFRPRSAAASGSRDYGQRRGPGSACEHCHVRAARSDACRLDRDYGRRTARRFPLAVASPACHQLSSAPTATEPATATAEPATTATSLVAAPKTAGASLVPAAVTAAAGDRALVKPPALRTASAILTGTSPITDATQCRRLPLRRPARAAAYYVGTLTSSPELSGARSSCTLCPASTILPEPSGTGGDL